MQEIFVTEFQGFDVDATDRAIPPTLFRAVFETETGPLALRVTGTVARLLLAAIVRRVPNADYQSG